MSALLLQSFILLVLSPFFASVVSFLLSVVRPFFLGLFIFSFALFLSLVISHCFMSVIFLSFTL